MSYRIALIGAVGTAQVTLQKLIEHEMNLVGVLGQEPEDPTKVSGLADLEQISRKNKLPYHGFQRINDEENRKWLESLKPDIVFAVGFSQLVAPEVLSLARLGFIGFHPTNLPKGRGRAPLAWLTLEKEDGAACFFLMGEGADDGPVFVMEPFEVNEEDYAEDVAEKILKATEKALDSWLPDLKRQEWNPQPQDHSQATWYGKRTPSDGRIDWQWSALYIRRLIQSAGRPHPGAFTFVGDEKCIIHRAKAFHALPIKGVVGRIVSNTEEGNPIVQCGEGHLELEEWEIADIEGKPVDKKLTVGMKLGYNLEYEIFKLRNKLK